MIGNNKYCENCDKWLDNPQDYEIKKIGRDDDVGGFRLIKCKTCGNEQSEQWWISGSYILDCWCKICQKETTSKEEWEKHKPNWRKRFVVAHDYYNYEKDNKSGIKKINHSCSVKCNAFEGCGKEFTFNSGDEELINILHKYISEYRYCLDCQIKKWEKDGDEEDKKDLKRLKEIMNRSNGNDPERERERERAELPNYELRYRN